MGTQTKPRKHGNRATDCESPVGSSRNPAVLGMPIGQFPAPRECPEAIRSIDWESIRDRLMKGDAVRIVVDDDDLEALRDAVLKRLGMDVIARSPQAGTLCICSLQTLLPDGCEE